MTSEREMSQKGRSMRFLFPNVSITKSINQSMGVLYMAKIDTPICSLTPLSGWPLSRPHEIPRLFK